MSAPKPVMLIVLDGWGHREEIEDNAIAAANTPNWDALKQAGAFSLIDTSGMAVGLPEGQMGNSEVGHVTLGAGRVIYQEYTRISKAIAEDTIADNAAIDAAMSDLAQSGKALHLMGLLSPGGVHSHEEHLHGLIRLAKRKGVQQVYVHAFLDGRDTPPRSAEASLLNTEAVLAECGVGRMASMVGRYFAMDRDNRWERVQPAYELMVAGQAEHQASDAVTGLMAAYARDENDEFVAPTILGEPVVIADGDAMMFFNFRADRAREITRAFIEPAFDGFERSRMPSLSHFVCLTEYHADFDAAVAYPPEPIINGLGEYVSAQGKTQLRIAETEKYAHVSFFFSGGKDTEYAGETRTLVPSPKVATYDLQPEMSAPEVTDELVAAIKGQQFDLIVCNYANPDMVGHTGVFSAAVKAVEAIDTCLGRVREALESVNGEMLITADHGNVEMMHDHSTGQAHTAHTTFTVPLVYLGRNAELRSGGSLCDIAPTLLAMMDVPQPAEMTGQSLIKFDAAG